MLFFLFALPLAQPVLLPVVAGALPFFVFFL